MSFTLMRYKDGKETPIKVSILDAFRSAPPRRTKSVQTEEKKVSPRPTFPQTMQFRLLFTLHMMLLLHDGKARSSTTISQTMSRQ
jgi:hypothetical protein